jgi:hypothetical protein
MLSRVAATCGLVVLALLGCFVAPGPAGEPASPGYEVKLFLNPKKVLKKGQEPSQDLIDFLGISGPPARLRMAFLDSNLKELHAEGWNVRLREVEGKKELEVTYKRRYPVPDDLDGTLAVAARQGFDAGETEYEAEVEWGYRKKTLSFTRKKEVEKPGGDAFPSAKEARRLAASELPGKLDHWVRQGWAESVLTDARLYGPVEARRWAGSRDDVDDKIVLELWQVRKPSGDGEEPLVEVSFKKKDPAKATSGREQLLKRLQDKKGWLVEDDVLKTERILERYR